MIRLLTPIRRIPPTISAARNCQPRKINISIPNSITRFVEANMNATEEMKCAPLAKRLLAVARAAKEQELEADPKTAEIETLCKPPPPICRVKGFLGTNACIIALIEYPSIKAHIDFQKKPADVNAASPHKSKNEFISSII